MNKENMANRTSEFWGICCEGGKKYSQVVQQKFRITMAALDPTVKSISPVVSLMVDRNGSEYILCNLKPSSILQVKLDLYFDKGERVTFSLKGQGKVYLTGYHIYENSDSVIPTAVQNIKTKKVQCESPLKAASASPQKANFLVAKVSDDSSATNETKKKNLKKNKTVSPKKLDAKTSSNGAESEDEDTFDELEDSSEDEESEEENDADSNRLKSYKRLWSSLTQSDDEEEVESDEADDEDSSKKKGTDSPNKKKLKNEIAEGKKSSFMVMDNKDSKALQKKTPKKDTLNSSIGRTPMPQKKTNKMLDSNDASKTVTPKKVTFDDDSSDSDNEINTSLTVSPSKAEQSATPSSEGKKKKKKKKKKSIEGITTEEPTADKPTKVLSSASYSQKMNGGLEFEDIRVGNGPIAKKGRLVHVYYIGTLANNKVFDSREIGNKPFSFKLGANDVIKGWDMAIEGMKVGGKRRMKIPPNLGYENKRMGPIPPNSTLFFTVELKAVS